MRNVDDVWGADLVDMKSLSSDNDGYNIDSYWCFQ